MIFRGILYGTLLAIPFWVLVAVGIAKADPVAVPAPPALQAQGDATGEWLSATLHAYVAPRQLYVAPELSEQDAGQFWYPSGNVYLVPWVSRSLMSSLRDIAAGDVLVHEYLHRADTAPCWTRNGFREEEGIVDAVTNDLLAAWSWRFWRMGTIRIRPAYPDEVAAIRYWSARYTGSSSWRTPAARTARRVLWGASCAGRLALLSTPTRGGSY